MGTVVLPTVWIINAGNHLYDGAEKFGNLKVLTEGRVNVFAPDNLVRKCKEKLVDANCEDFLLVSGYSIPNAIVVHYFLKRFGFAKILIWEANNRKYKAITLHDFDPNTMNVNPEEAQKARRAAAEAAEEKVAG
jgi:hypothetical protein